MAVKFLSLDQILIAHQILIDTFGGHHGIRDLGLLESALNQPSVSFAGQLFHADLLLQWRRPIFFT